MAGRYEQFGTLWDAGNNLYLVIWSDVEALNPSSGAWGIPGTWSNYVTDLVEKSLGRTDQSAYEIFGSLGFDLQKICPTLIAPNVGRQCVARIYRQTGGSKNPATDPILSEESFHVAFGRRGIGATDLPRIEFKTVPGYRKDLTPKLAEFWVQIHVNEEPINLTGVSGSHYIRVQVRKEGESADMIDVQSSTIGADGRWFLEYESPTYEKDRLYWATVSYHKGSSMLLQRSVPWYGA